MNPATDREMKLLGVLLGEPSLSRVHISTIFSIAP